MSDSNIRVHKASVHNLKKISVDIPRGKFVVITGVSGSGKSSLAFDTLYAEGQRLYVESLSSYARQFLGRMNKPEVAYIHGIPPAIAIEQRIRNSNPRSTVGTVSEVYDYIKLLFARIGKTYSPISGKEVKKHTVDDVLEFIQQLAPDIRYAVVAPVQVDSLDTSLMDHYQSLGFTMFEWEGKMIRMQNFPDLINQKEWKSEKNLNLVVDRLKTGNDKDFSRVADSLQQAFDVSEGRCLLVFFPSGNQALEYYYFSAGYEADGMLFEEPTEHFFSFNNPLGACPTCGGYGNVLGIDEKLVIPDQNRSVYQDAVACWRGDKLRSWKHALIEKAAMLSFPIHTPYFSLSEEEKKILWHGASGWAGINGFFSELEEKMYKIQNRVLLSRYRGKTTCPDCKGTRLRRETSYVQVGGYTIQDLVSLPLVDLAATFRSMILDDYDEKIAKLMLDEIRSRLGFLLEAGVGYLTLNRTSGTLSGGESQRIHLASSLGSSLVGALYILDEPSIGLHPRDTHLLLRLLIKLRDIGNTVIVVEHEEEIIRQADHIIDIGPYAGELGGEVVFQGSMPDLFSQHSCVSLTFQYLTGKKRIEKQGARRTKTGTITLEGARLNNLNNIHVDFPLGVLCVVTGVSGSGKSSLVSGLLVPALQKQLGQTSNSSADYSALSGDLHCIHAVELVDQSPIGRSSRSNPVTYIKAWDDIRKLLSEQNAAKQYGLKPSHFSFNVPGGRCENCQGEGELKVEMQFMADVTVVCEECDGKRFKDEVLAVHFRKKNVHEILSMTVDEALLFFEGDQPSNRKIMERLRALADVGLGYIQLGQSSSTLSGGEAQRVKLASFLLKKEQDQPVFFVFDEPTTGLHFHDISKLLHAFDALIKQGHSIVVVEHNLDVIKMSDWIIDLGPEGGKQGGQLVFSGTPEQILTCDSSYTGQYLLHKQENQF